MPKMCTKAYTYILTSTVDVTNAVAYRQYEHVVDVHLDFVDVLQFEGQILHSPLVFPTVHSRLDDKDVGKDRFAGAAPLLTAAQQRLPQIVHVPWTTRHGGVVCSHRYGVVGLRRLIVDHHRDVIA